MSRLPAIREHENGTGTEINPFHSEQEAITETQLALSTFTNAAIDTQIATARKFPRSVAKFLREAEALVCLNKRVAGTCFYDIPRGGKTIKGPSVRLAELAQIAWGNLRISAMKTSDDGKYVTATAIGLDLEKNNGIQLTAEQQVVDGNGKRYSDDMVRVASAAACAKARRNVVFALIPKTFIEQLEQMARETVRGSLSTIEADREHWLNELGKIGVSHAEAFAYLKIGGKQDMTLDHTEQIAGVLSAINEQHTTVDDVFRPAPVPVKKAPKSTSLADKIESVIKPREPGDE